MENLLFLVHRIPYPPNKGDKIRSFHFLKAIAEHYRVIIGAFIDDPEDWKFERKLDDFCAERFCLPINPKVAKIKSLSGFLTGEALSLPYYRNKQMQQWVAETIKKHDIRKVMIYSSVMAQYVPEHKDIDMIVDFVDVDSDKWRQYAGKKKWPESWIYQREAKKLFEFEEAVIKRSKTSFFVSEKEAELFHQLSPLTKDKVTSVNNGVDIQFFQPDFNAANPYKDNEKVMVFTGAMDYWPNIDAVSWFAKKIFPQIFKQDSSARFYIVGSNPSKEVQALAQEGQIIVTGRVEEIRPYLTFAHFAVAPLQIARGIQNKVLEAMAMEKNILATSAAMEGIYNYDLKHVIMNDDQQQIVNEACRLLKLTDVKAPSNREFVEKNFSWRSNGERLLQLLS